MKSALLTDSTSEVAMKTWFSNISDSLWILSLREHEFKSSFDSKHDEVDDEVSQFSDEVVLSEKGSSEVSGTGDLR